MKKFLWTRIFLDEFDRLAGLTDRDKKILEDRMMKIPIAWDVLMVTTLTDVIRWADTLHLLEEENWRMPSGIPCTACLRKSSRKPRSFLEN